MSLLVGSFGQVNTKLVSIRLVLSLSDLRNRGHLLLAPPLESKVLHQQIYFIIRLNR